jgi:hypothetical protein
MSVFVSEQTVQPAVCAHKEEVTTWWKEAYCHVSQWLKTEFGLVIGFINNLKVVTTNNSYSIADLHNLQSLHTNLLILHPLVFTIRFLATDL